MNESQATSQLMSKMRERGYLVRKIHGTLHSGKQPDYYACSGRVTVFFEAKLFKIHPAAFSRIPLEVDAQMLSVEEHDAKGIARYLFIFKDRNHTWIMCLEPHVVRALAASRGLIDGAAMSKEDHSWLREDLPQLFTRKNSA